MKNRCPVNLSDVVKRSKVVESGSLGFLDHHVPFNPVSEQAAAGKHGGLGS